VRYSCIHKKVKADNLFGRYFVVMNMAQLMVFGCVTVFLHDMPALQVFGCLLLYPLMMVPSIKWPMKKHFLNGVNFLNSILLLVLLLMVQIAQINRNS
jgi:hypothetical protein